jgi:general secretion pathway protein L
MRKFFDWWFGQLAQMVPTGIWRAAMGSSDAVILEIDRHCVRLGLRQGGDCTRIAETHAMESGIAGLAEKLSEKTDVPRTILLRPLSTLVLHKQLTLPLAARRDLENVLGFEIDRETPFASDEVHWTYRVVAEDAARGRIDVNLALVPRSIVDPYVVAARHAGLEPTGIEVDIAGMAARIGLGTENRARWLRLERPLMPLAAAVAALAVFVVLTPFIVQQWALASSEIMIAKLADTAREAAGLRKSADEFVNAAELFAQQRKRHLSTLAVLAAATRALPDDSHLTSLSIRDGKVTMSGLSPSAAGLIGVLAKTREFREPAFAAPVVQNEGDLESFTIAAELSEPSAP